MKNKINTLRPEIIQQLLFTKSLLSQMQLLPEAKPSTFSIAKKILIAHDVAEMGIAAVANQIGALPKKNQRFLMDYFTSIKDKTGQDAEGREYCRNLNIVRGSLKHGMILPDPNQWVKVGDKIYSYLSDWCQAYLGTSLDDMDNSMLINNTNIKSLYDDAKKEFAVGHYRQVLELLGKALYILFKENSAIRAIPVGTPRAEDAIKLATFGVHANDYLALQEFLPRVTESADGVFLIRWTQENFGHPGNWQENPASFCIDAFLDLALKIQDAGWIPGAIPFLAIYEYKIEATKDNVEIWSEDWGEVYKPGFSLLSPKRKVIRVLKKGESIRGMVYREQKASLGLLGYSQMLGYSQIKDKEPEKISIVSEELKGDVALQDVKITCVPRDGDIIKEYFPDLPEIDMQLD